MNEITLTGSVVQYVHECMLRLCILLNSLLYICVNLDSGSLRVENRGIFAPLAARAAAAWHSYM